MAKLTLIDLKGGYLSVSAVNANYVLMEAALENTLSRDGTTPNTMSADIDMNSAGRITNLQDAVNNQEPVTLAQAGLLAGVTNALTQDTVAAVLWPQSALETANSVTATELQYYYGDVQRYGAKLDGATDDTAAFNNAIRSGWAATCDHGTAAISGTITLNGSKTLLLSATVTLQRFAGSAVTPLVQMYGNLNHFDGKGAVIRQNLYEHASGIVLLGQTPSEATVPGTTNVNTTLNVIQHIKIVGPENTAAELETGSPGLYIHSAGRKLGDHTGVVTYKNTLNSVEVVNCDIGVEFSSDANANTCHHLHIHQYISGAIKFNGSYGNDLYGVQIENVLDNVTPSATERFAIHLLAVNDGVETGTSASYLITSAHFNHIQGFAELENSGNKVVRLVKVNENGAVVGRNDIDIVGTIAGGIGTGGVSTDAATGNNRIKAGGLLKDITNIIKLHGMEFRSLDDNSGFIQTQQSWAKFTGREVSIAEATQTNAFSVDGIGPNSAAAIIKVTYAAKSDASASGQVGEVHFAVWQESDSGDYFKRKIFESNTSFDEAQIVTPNVVVAAGTGSTLMKATMGWLTAAPAGTNLFHISWVAEVVSTELDTGANYDLYIKIL